MSTMRRTRPALRERGDLPLERGPMAAEIGDLITDGMGRTHVVDDVPASGPIERDQVLPGEHVLVYLPKWPRAGGWEDYSWERVDARYATFCRCNGLHFDYRAIVAHSYTGGAA